MFEPTEELPELAYYDRRIVEVLDYGAHVSLILFREVGMEYEIYVENSDLEFIEDGIGYESE